MLCDNNINNNLALFFTLGNDRGKQMYTFKMTVPEQASILKIFTPEENRAEKYIKCLRTLLTMSVCYKKSWEVLKE